MFVKNWYKILSCIWASDANAESDGFASVGIVNLNNEVWVASGSLYNAIYDVFLHNNNAAPYLGRCLTTDTPSQGGVIFGDGSTPVSLDDYKLSGNIIKTYSVIPVVNKAITDNGMEFTCTYTLTNTGDSDIVISEVGILSAWGAVLIERTVLDAPVTIAPDGTGQITYTIRLNYPV